LSDELLHKLAGISCVRSFRAGEILFEEGMHIDEMYLIWSGRVALDMNVPGDGSRRILTLGPGDIAGWSPLLELGALTASAVAMENTETVVVPAGRLLEECRKHPELGYEIMRRVARQLARRLLATRLQLVELETTRLAPSSQPYTAMNPPQPAAGRQPSRERSKTCP
jgi:CRP-like cAMP-binding protein